VLGEVSETMKKLALFGLSVLLSHSALAEIDFTGEWAPAYHEDAPERLPGPELGDYMGLPLNDAARLQADSWDADRISMLPQYQCRPHSADYGMRGLGNLRITREFDPLHERLIAFRTYMPAWGSTRVIWLDGRPHPPDYAEHTFQGFSTGVWEGNQLTITTTHLKTNYHRRNGVPSSDQRTFTEHWMRHGDILTVVTVVDDPVFFTEPLVRSENWYLDPGQQLPQFYCEYTTEVPPVTPDSVPHHLPGENPHLTEIAGWYGLPTEVLRGGAEKMYPEYRLEMGEPETLPPPVCELYCNCDSFLGCL
jgi:hypothetical protein